MTQQTRAVAITTPSDLEITMTRTFKAPAALVFDAWTNCEHLEHWWGTPHMPLSECSIDLRPGGRWRYVMRTPDGSSEMGMYGEYREVDRPGRLVSTEYFEGDEFENMGGGSINSMTLEESGGMTVMVVTSLYKSKEARDRVLRTDFERGVEESFQVLDAFLAQTIEGGN